MAKKKKVVARKKAAKKKSTPKGRWQASEIAMLKKLFPNNPTAALAKDLKRNVDAVKKKASRMGLKKTRKYMKSIGRG